MAEQIVTAPFRALDANGDPVSGAKASFFVAGTATPITVYTDASLSTAHPSPLVADSSGTFDAVWVGGSQDIKVVITKEDDSALDVIDPAIRVSNESGAATNVSFSPVTGIGAVNVQAAIESVYDSIPDTTTFSESLLDDGSASSARNTLGLGSAAVLDAQTTVSDTDSEIPTGGAVFDHVAGQAIGVGQAWVNLTASRSDSTWYENDTGRTIFVNIYGRSASASTGRTVYVTADTSAPVAVGGLHQDAGNGIFTNISFPVPDGHFYKIDGTAQIQVWAELR